MLPETWEEQQQVSPEPEEVPGDLNIACSDRMQVGADLEAVVFSLSVGSKMAQKKIPAFRWHRTQMKLKSTVVAFLLCTFRFN